MIGGAETVTEVVALELHRRGHAVEVMTMRLPPLVEEEAYHGVPIHRLITTAATLGLDPLTIMQERRRARALVAAFQPEVMVLINPLSIMVHLQGVQPVHQARAIFWLQGFIEPTLEARLVSGQILRSADYVLACSHALLDSARLLAPEITDHSGVLWNTVPEPSLEPSPLPWDPPVVIYVGRFSFEKGVNFLISAFALAASQHAEVRLVLAGDGPDRPRLEAQVDALGLRARVEFLGWVLPADVPGAINKATFLALPSVTEGLGIVAVQAAQMGRPMVGFRVGGIPEACSDGETGLLCEPENIEDLAAKILRLVQNRAETEAMGRAAKLRAATLFGWDTFAQATEAIIQQVVTP
jgi:glycogen(starch) synthase